LQDIDEDITSVFGTKNFHNISFGLRSEGGKNHLEIYPSKKQETNLGVNLNYFNSTKSAFIIRALFRNILATPSRLTLIGRASENYGLKMDYFYRSGRHRNILLGFDGKINKFDRGFYFEDNLRSLYKNFNSTAAFGLAIESSTRSIASFKIGFDRDFIKPKVLIDLDINKYIKTQFFGSLRYVFNSLDNPYFATKGMKLDFVASYKLGRKLKVDYNTEEASEFVKINEAPKLFDLFASANFNRRFSSKFVTQTNLTAYYSSQNTLTDNIRVGGTNINTDNSAGFTGLNEFELNLSKMILLRNDLRFEVFPKIYIGLGLNYLIGENAFPSLLNMQENAEDLTLFGWGIHLAYDSPIGPFVFDVGVADGGTKSSFSFGHRFIF